MPLEDALKKDSVDIFIGKSGRDWGGYKMKIGVSAPVGRYDFFTHNSPVMKLNVEF